MESMGQKSVLKGYWFLEEDEKYGIFAGTAVVESEGYLNFGP